jgi:hypothetical protein
MKGKIAARIFLAICIILSILLLTHTITIITSSSLFAIALILLGGLSKGFRKP